MRQIPGLCDFLNMTTECELSELYYHLSIRKEVRTTDLTPPHPLVPLDAGYSPSVPWSAQYTTDFSPVLLCEVPLFVITQYDST